MVSYHPHPYFLSLCLFVYFSLCVTVCPFFRPSVRPSVLTTNRLSVCLLHHQPSLPTSTEQLWNHTSVSLQDSNRYRQVHLLAFISLDRFCCCRPYLQLGTFGWQCIFQSPGEPRTQRKVATDSRDCHISYRLPDCRSWTQSVSHRDKLEQ